ncbi:MAG: GNAT family N-acetyltransferase [Pirellulaceae bacterium]
MSSATPSGRFQSTRNDARLVTDDAQTTRLAIAAITRSPHDAPQHDAAPYDAPPVEPAGPGDHPLIYQLLRTVFHAPSDSEFHAQLDHPRYEPTHRLLVRRRGAPAAHLRACPREIRFGGVDLAADYLADLACLPEFRRRGFATALLAAAEREAARHAADLLLLRTSLPAFYAARGWIVCGRHCYSSAPPRNILAMLSTLAAEKQAEKTVSVRESTAPRLRVRLWRHIEQERIMQLYADAAAASYGALVRSEAYWHWLLCRRGYDHIYVAVERAADEPAAEEEVIVGYAVMHRGRIVELVAQQQRGDVKAALLARACGDAIERDEHSVRFDGPPGDPLHAMFQQADGVHRWREVDGDLVHMVKVLDPLRLVRRLADLLHQRAREAALTRPFELGVDCEGNRFCLVGTRRSVRIETGRLGRSYLTCSPSGLTQLLLGHHDASSALAAEHCTASTRTAETVAAALFPRLPLWYPPLDDLPA